MQSNSLRATALLSLSLGALAVTPACQEPSAAASASVLQPDDVPGLPSFLLKVPGGNVLMGLEVEDRKSVV